jgi:hypothetical protein
MTPKRAFVVVARELDGRAERLRHVGSRSENFPREHGEKGVDGLTLL